MNRLLHVFALVAMVAFASETRAESFPPTDLFSYGSGIQLGDDFNSFNSYAHLYGLHAIPTSLSSHLTHETQVGGVTIVHGSVHASGVVLSSDEESLLQDNPFGGNGAGPTTWASFSLTSVYSPNGEEYFYETEVWAQISGDLHLYHGENGWETQGNFNFTGEGIVPLNVSTHLSITEPTNGLSGPTSWDFSAHMTGVIITPFEGTFAPGPASAALLGVAALAGRRRRR